MPATDERPFATGFSEATVFSLSMFWLGVHPERGDSTVAELLTLLANHDLNHLRQIRTALDESGREAK
jgi:uncharacterized damage-inducible protein DinB